MKRSRHLIGLLGFVGILALVFGAVSEPRQPVTHVVRIENMKFSPDVIRVHPGDTIEFQNLDLVPHTATERSSQRFDSGLISGNAKWKWVAPEAGTFNYRCLYHPEMAGTIIVGPSAPATARSARAAVELCGGP